MHLKTLTLRGFKSFASATTLHLEPGITCVVGPNGSGKSNVVDALAWVMGEQGAKTLRGGSMSDVIFAGTSSRAPLGRAEVSLTIDNTDGLLPIEYTEVTISRTLFRSGGSEYAINGTPCRLLDIQELLSDTGLGREMHVIVGQGRLDSVLQATPEDRRGFIEEAAGVLKHRRRKEKALRKLEAMAANLARVTDLSAEIRRQLGPLARQADVARRAQVVQADLRDARARLLADDLVQLTATLAQEVADETALRERREAVEAAQEEARGRLTALEQAAAAAAPRLGQATDVWYRLSGLRERLRSLESVATERCRLLGSPTAEPVRGGRDPDELETKAAAVREQEDALRTELDAARATLEAAVAERTRAEETERDSERALAAVHRGVADRREGLARLTGQVGARRSRLEAAEAELGRLRESLAAAQERASTAQAEFTALEQQVAGAEEGEENLDEAHEAATAALEDAERDVAELVEAERAAQADRATWTARRETLELSLRRKDGTGALLAAGLAGVLGTVPEHLSVEPGWENAVAAALGASADAAVVESVDVAVDAVRQVRESDAGQVRLVVAGGAQDDGGGRPSAPAGSRWALDLLTSARDELRPALGRLLADVVAVEDLAEARAVLTAQPALTAVTRAGDVLSGVVAHGGAPGAPSVLELHAAHEEAAAEVESATARHEQARFALGPARERVETARAQVRATLDDLHASDARLAAVAEQLGRLGSTLRNAQAEAERARPAIERAEAEIAEHASELQALAERLEIARREPAQAEEDLAGATETRDRATEVARAARTRETDARLALRTLEEQAKGLAGRAASLAAAAREERAARRRAAEREARRAAQAAVAAEVRDGAARAAAAIDRSVAAAAAERERAEEERTERERAIAGVRAELEEIGTELAALTDVAHRDEVARAEQRLRITQLEEKAVAELGLDPQVLVDEFGPDRPVPSTAPVPDGEEAPQARPYVREEQEKRLRTAERDLARLGKVNPLALEEHAALAERHKFLTDQLADLKKSRADLMEIVREVDERVERVFSEAFADTARQFEQVFPRLFPGGEGRLVLTDPGNMLTTGIEIEARPAGKKVKRLSLLSGGERSLTAVALLVSIFKARPSPFYVMDEVEAALDDVNLGRLLEIFTELRDSSQLIVITHQKRTMEVADALYGVTMRGDGVTTVISQRLEREPEPAA
ncbi:chromosome segregation protein SMC [Georgenia sp. EYE_87]|uniref:chromosome segregation protein SMC n=1 Tax=Georgenia sp. EYE_87 TaxID=2853448 RepID=UPI0020055ACD|nr:chromosome segregation protein SMC [Georgenia sp. EYE_87]MCK6210657.1 chromosome segregation protein SMC [Georgenia sp. EYE_87]